MVRKKKMASATRDYVTVRVPRSLYDEVTELKELFSDEAAIAKGSANVSVAMAIRWVIKRGIKAVKASKSRE